MHSLGQKEKVLLMKLETEGLSTTQLRLIKTIHSLLANVVACEEESEYFEASADLLKKAAELIKLSNFAVENNNMSYGDQAIEFAVDSLNETMGDQKLQSFDN